MVTLKLKGNDLTLTFLGHSSARYAVFFRNHIIATLKKIDVPSHHVKITEEITPLQKVPAEAFWYIDGRNCYYNYGRQERYVDNLHVISKLLQAEVDKVLHGEKTVEEFIHDFREEDDLAQKRKEARELLQLQEHEANLEVIDKQFKKMARESHPDMPTGSTERFKKLNEAHKLLKKELE